MPCSKRPLVKNWDKPKNLRVVKPSRYQQNEASVKVHWKNVIKDLELLYKDEQFWETQAHTVLELVGPVIFERLVKIFNLQIDEEDYVPASEPSTIQSSDEFYLTMAARSVQSQLSAPRTYSLSDFDPEEEEESEGEESSWSNTTAVDKSESKASGAVDSTRSLVRMTNRSMNRSLNQPLSTRSMNKFNRSMTQSLHKSFSKVYTSAMSRTFNKSAAKSFVSVKMESETDFSAHSSDDIFVHASLSPTTRRRGRRARHIDNPHFEMLYCNDSESDMIKWNSNYKEKKMEVSASDECSKKAELLTKQIAMEFYDWWVGLGSDDYKSEIKTSMDIEQLFQVWFDEHASRGLVLDPKILPCVLKTIAEFVGAPSTACDSALKRQVAADIHAETSPPHTLAFGKCLPLRLKHIPPQNNTKEAWHCVKIPEDLRSMAAVWEDISHLTSTKAFQKWLGDHVYMPMPPYLAELASAGDKKQLFVIPSDFVVRDTGSGPFSKDNLNIPVSQFSLEIKEVLSRLLTD